MEQKDNEVLELRAKLQRVEDAFETVNEKASQSLMRMLGTSDGPEYVAEVAREAAYFKGLHTALLALGEAMEQDTELPK